MDRTRLARHLVRAALAYYQAALWRRFHSNQVIAVLVPDQPAPVFASISSPAAAHGLTVFRGPTGLRTIQRLIAADPEDEIRPEADSLGILFEPPSALDAEYQVLLREAKFAGNPAPRCYAKPQGRLPRPTNRGENELLLWVLEGLLAADAQGLLRPVEPRTHGRAAVWTLRLAGKPTAPEVRAKFEEHAPSQAQAPARVMVPDGASELPRNRQSWWVSTPLMPGRIEGDDRELRVIMVFDETNDRILKAEVVFDVGPAEVAETLFAACRADAAAWLEPAAAEESETAEPVGLPAHVAFDRRDLHEALGPALGAVGVARRFVPEIAKVGEILDDFLAYHDSSPGGKAAADGPGAEAPADDDLAGWKRIDADLSDRFGRAAMQKSRLMRHAADRYFGGPPDLRDEDAPFAFGCFADWFACSYHYGHGTPTAAEQLLADGSLAPGTQQLMAARAAAKIALYRVAAVTPDEALELEDVLVGGRVRVTERAMAQSGTEGAVLFGKVYPAGKFLFFAAHSAPLPFATEATLSFLEEQGLKLTPEGLQRRPHLLGRLWGARAMPAVPPKLVNTDGEELLDVRASFDVRSEAEVRKALLQRRDVEVEDEDQDDVDAPLAWFRDKGDGSRVLLGRLEFVGGQLLATVNSDQRLLRLRQWLLEVAGVLGEASVTRRGMMDAPVDDRVGAREPSGPPPPELVQAVREHMVAHYRRWLDEPIPALGGRTPRQAVATAEGRRKVARLIRTMPDPGGPAGPMLGAVPREEMLRELGLQADEGASGV